MSRHLHAIMIVGIVVPVVALVVVMAGSVAFFFHVHHSFQQRTAIYASLQKYLEIIQTLEPDAQFLDAEIPQLSSLYNMESFINHLQSAAQGDNRIKILSTDENVSTQAYGTAAGGRVLKMEGLSGPVIPLLGESLQKYIPIFTDSWNVRLVPEKNLLAFDITATVAPFKP